MNRAAAGSFGELLVRHRIAAGFSQRAVAVKSVLSERAVRDLERGSTACRSRDRFGRSPARSGSRAMI
jgi:transcriptional regulator with XRE-family HTH domain